MNEHKVFEFNWRSDESKEIEKDTWEMIPLTNVVHFSVYFTNELQNVDLLAIFENGKMKMVKRVVGFNEALNKPKPKKVIVIPQRKKSLMQLAEEMPKWEYENLSIILEKHERHT